MRWEGRGALGAEDGSSRGHGAGTGGPASTGRAVVRDCTAPGAGNQKTGDLTAAAEVEDSPQLAGQELGTHSSCWARHNEGPRGNHGPGSEVAGRSPEVEGRA